MPKIMSPDPVYAKTPGQLRPGQLSDPLDAFLKRRAGFPHVFSRRRDKNNLTALRLQRLAPCVDKPLASRNKPAEIPAQFVAKIHVMRTRRQQKTGGNHAAPRYPQTGLVSVTVFVLRRASAAIGLLLETAVAGASCIPAIRQRQRVGNLNAVLRLTASFCQAFLNQAHGAPKISRLPDKQGSVMQFGEKMLVMSDKASVNVFIGALLKNFPAELHRYNFLIAGRGAKSAVFTYTAQGFSGRVFFACQAIFMND